MKAITLHAPYATLIANGTKTIETRGWERGPPKWLIGERIAIHQALNRGPKVREACLALTEDGALLAVSRAGDALNVYPDHPDTEVATNYGAAGRGKQTVTGTPCATYPLGAVVATAVMEDAGRIVETRHGYHPHSPRIKGAHVKTHYHPSHPTRGDWSIGRWTPVDPYGYFAEGRWLWFLEDVRPIEPAIPAKGAQGFWDWEPA